ncbi:MAG: putative signal transducing protein [Actinomycetota bacterium]
MPKLVRVLSTASVPEGEIAKARLEDEGIPVLLKGEGTGPYRMGPVHLYVTADVEVQARLVLEATFALDAEDEEVPQRDEAEDTEPG